MSNEIVEIIEDTYVIEIDNSDDVLIVDENVVEVIEVAEQDPEGIQGVPGAPAIVVNFQFGDVASQVIHTFTANGYFLRLRAEISVPFDGDGSGISVGTVSDNNLLLSADEIFTSQVMAMEKANSASFNTDDEIRLFITPGFGATQGSGRVILEVT